MPEVLLLKHEKGNHWISQFAIIANCKVPCPWPLFLRSLSFTNYLTVWPTNMSFGLYNNFQWKNHFPRPSGVQGMFKSIGLLSECIRHSRLRSSRQRSEFAKESTTPGAGGNRCPPADDLGKISTMSRYPEFKKNTRFVSNQREFLTVPTADILLNFELYRSWRIHFQYLLFPLLRIKCK